MIIFANFYDSVFKNAINNMKETYEMQLNINTSSSVISDLNYLQKIIEDINYLK